MRKIMMCAIALFLSVASWGQDVVIEAKDKGSEMVLMATNNEDSDVKVTVELDAKGYDIGPSNEIEVLIPGKQTIEVGRYKRDKSQTASFTYGYSLTQTTTKEVPKSGSTKKSSSSDPNAPTTNLIPNDGSLKDVKGLYVYSMNKCGRCKFAVDFLESNNIPFTEKNMDLNKDDKSDAFRYLKACGFEGGSFATPLIINDGKVSYNINDLKGFLNELK